MILPLFLRVDVRACIKKAILFLILLAQLILGGSVDRCMFGGHLSRLMRPYQIQQLLASRNLPPVNLLLILLGSPLKLWQC